MKKIPFYSFRFMLAVMSAVVLILAFTPGCRILTGFDNDPDVISTSPRVSVSG